MKKWALVSAIVVFTGILSLIISPSITAIPNPIDTTKKIGEFGENVPVFILSHTLDHNVDGMVWLFCNGPPEFEASATVDFTKDGLITTFPGTLELECSGMGEDHDSYKRFDDDNDMHLELNCINIASGDESNKQRDSKVGKRGADKDLRCKVKKNAGGAILSVMDNGGP